MSSINEILKDDDTEKLFRANAAESMPTFQWLLMQVEKESVMKQLANLNELSSRGGQKQSVLNALPIFYSLLQNQLNGRVPSVSTRNDVINFWSLLWLEKLKRVNNLPTSTPNPVNNIFGKTQNDNGNCLDEKLMDIVGAESIQGEKNGQINSIENSLQSCVTPSTVRCADGTITNENCNLRSRELWKKWSLETPNYDASRRQSDGNTTKEIHLIDKASTIKVMPADSSLVMTEEFNDGGFKCARCGKMFSYAYYRDKHLKYTRCVDNGNRKFPCSFCSRSFEKRDRLRIHILHVHENHRPHVCSTCGKAFSQSSSLNKHLRVHSGERPYQCPFCTKCFTASSILRTHIRQHSGEKPFKCVFCGKSFASHAAHDSHVRRTHPKAGTVAHTPDI